MSNVKSEHDESKPIPRSMQVFEEKHHARRVPDAPFKMAWLLIVHELQALDAATVAKAKKVALVSSISVGSLDFFGRSDRSANPRATVKLPFS